MKRILLAWCAGLLAVVGTATPAHALSIEYVDAWFDVPATAVSPLGAVDVSGSYVCNSGSGALLADIVVSLHQIIDVSNAVSGQATIQDVQCGRTELQHWAVTVRPDELQGSLALRLFQVGRPIQATVKILPDGDQGEGAEDQATLLKDAVDVHTTLVRLLPDRATMEINGVYTCNVEGGASIVQMAFVRTTNQVTRQVTQGATTVVLPCTANGVPWQVRVIAGQCGNAPMAASRDAAEWDADSDVSVDLIGDEQTELATTFVSRDRHDSGHWGSHRRMHFH